MGEGIAGIVAQTGEPLLIEDATNDKRFIASSTSNVSNLLCVPLKVYEETIGVINMSNKKNNKTFTKEDLKIILTLADQAAVAINNARLYEMAVTDGLTKLFIRRHFLQSLDTELRRSQRYGHPLSLMMIDIDHFKNLNDTYGHQAGDLVLAEVSKIFRKSIRSTDIAARYGGEEFCILLPETPISGVLVIGERLRKEVEKSVFNYHGVEIKCTISLGSATFPVDAGDPQDLIRKADLALYQSKNGGRNKLTTFSKPDNETVVSKRKRAEKTKKVREEVPDIKTLDETDSDYEQNEESEDNENTEQNELAGNCAENKKAEEKIELSNYNPAPLPDPNEDK
jgi:diguanylate cyclase (GGDEF)-like protein